MMITKQRIEGIVFCFKSLMLVFGGITILGFILAQLVFFNNLFINSTIQDKIGLSIFAWSTLISGVWILCYLLFKVLEQETKTR